MRRTDRMDPAAIAVIAFWLGIVFTAVFLIGHDALAQRTGVALLNTKTNITEAQPGAILVGDPSDKTWAQVLPASASYLGSTYLTSARPLFAGAITGNVYFLTDSTTTVETDVRALAPVAGHCDNFCCHCDTAPGGSGRTFALRVNAVTTALSVSFGSGTSGKVCATASTSATLAAGDLYDFLATNPIASTNTHCACSCRLRIP